MIAFFWVILGAVGALGLLAVVSPRTFSVVAGRSIREDTQEIFSLLDKDFNLDRNVLPHYRPLGAAVLAAVALIAALIVSTY
jgi:hypothetical protein